jgi:adenine-specific DNA-methyltransferase
MADAQDLRRLRSPRNAPAAARINIHSAADGRHRILRECGTVLPELSFKGKEFVYNHHLTVPYRPIEVIAERSVWSDGAPGNFVIHGDNLHALKALLPTHAGRIDCIYIDPPYNTGAQTWEYNDNVNSPLMQQWLRENPVNHEDMLRDDKWLCMMYPRLRLLRELLKPDGTIFVSINDVEAPNLRLIMDEVFPNRFLGQLVWKSRQQKDNRNKTGLSTDHEYVLCYGRRLKGDPRDLSLYSNEDDDPRGDWTSGNMVGLADEDDRENLHYDLIDPATGINYGRPDQGWRYEPTTMAELIAENKVLWPTNPAGRPREKVFLNDLSSAPNTSSVIATGIYTKGGTEELKAIFGRRAFKFPKPTALLRFLIQQGCPDGGTILDSFAGSGTTAHAVLLENSDRDANIRFITVECESYADTLTAERLRRVIAGYEFEGVERRELLAENITVSRMERADYVPKARASLALLLREGEKLDMRVDDSKLIITAERLVQTRTTPISGSFAFCRLGAPLDLDALLQGKELPAFAEFGAWLFHTATGVTADAAAFDVDRFYLGRADGQDVWLIYRADATFLRSSDAALTLDFARALPNGRHLVFAPAKFASNAQLSALNVSYAPLPFSLYELR